jgi:hypothetical protein
MKYGKSTFVKALGVNGHKKHISLWCCECGQQKAIAHTMVIRHITKSCGCLQREALARTVINYRRKRYGEACFNSLLAGYRAGAKKRGLSFDLTLKEFADLVKQPCFYCGRAPSSVYRRKTCYGEFVYNGIDRVRSADGYTADNCVTCCHLCNNAKRTLDAAEFVKWIIEAHEHVIKTGVLAKLERFSTS